MEEDNHNWQIPFRLGDTRRNSLGSRRRDIFGLLCEHGGDPIHLIEARKQVACYFLHNCDAPPRIQSRNKIFALILSNPSLAFDKFQHRSTQNNSNSNGFYSPLTLLVWEESMDPAQLDMIFSITNNRIYQQRFLDRRFSVLRSMQELLCITVLDAPNALPLSDETLLYIISKVELGGTISTYSGVEKALLKRKHDIGSHLSWQVLKALLDKSLAFSKTFIAGRRLLGYLHLLCYEDHILDQVASLYPQLCDTVKLYWHEPERKPESYFNATVAAKMERLNQHQDGRLIKRIDSDRHNWTLAGWNGFMKSLTQCRGLQSLRLCLPTEWLALKEPDGWHALARFFQCLPPHLEHLSLGCGGPESRLLEPNDVSLRVILKGLMANPHRETGPICKRIHLFGFDALHCQILEELGQFFGSLEFGAAADVPDRPVVIGRMSGPAIQDAPAIRYGSLASEARGLGMWRALSKVPTQHTWGTIKTRYSFVNGSSRSGPPEARVVKAPRINQSRLTSLFIDTGGYQPNPTTTDITKAMVVMLELKTLRTLAIAARSISFGRISEATCFLGFQVNPVFEALLQNASLQKLILHGLSFTSDEHETQDIPSLLLKTLEDNRTIQELSAFEDKAVFTIFQGRPFHGYHFYADHATSLQIQFKCWINKFGAQKLRNPGITHSQFVKLLTGASRSRSRGDVGFSDALDAVIMHAQGAATSLKKFNKAYLILRHQRSARPQPLSWCNAMSWCHSRTSQYDAETLSILFGMLRQAPTVWSSRCRA